MTRGGQVASCIDRSPSSSPSQRFLTQPDPVLNTVIVLNMCQKTYSKKYKNLVVVKGLTLEKEKSIYKIGSPQLLQAKNRPGIGLYITQPNGSEKLDSNLQYKYVYCILCIHTVTYKYSLYNCFHNSMPSQTLA